MGIDKRDGASRKMVILSGDVPGEPCGLLGPQMAATIIRQNTPYHCIVVGIPREADRGQIKGALAAHFRGQRPVVGFSLLGGREDLFKLAGELKAGGAVTILAGPQAAVDFIGERGRQHFPHRFSGVSENFTFAVQGPAEQILPVLNDPGRLDRPRAGHAGLVTLGADGTPVRSPQAGWEDAWLRRVDWRSLHRIDRGKIAPLRITVGQVLQQIGCPHALRKRPVEIDYPACMEKRGTLRIPAKGCTFCDVAADKGFCGGVSMETVLRQIRGLPEGSDGRRIPFELINENPLPGLPNLIRAISDRGVSISQINLTLRADGLLKGADALSEALDAAGRLGFRILLSSVGFESFDDRILKNFNKGLAVETNLRAVELMRRVKRAHPRTFGYLREEGANHGLIHPTPWDTPESEAAFRRTASVYNLYADILPRHSTPLIIHHASALGDWVRGIEEIEGIRFPRYGTIVGWWDTARPA